MSSMGSMNMSHDAKTIPEFNTTEDILERWFLMSSPIPIISIWLAYMIFVLKIGPDLMKPRSPFKLNNVLLIYNAVQVLISLYIFKLGGGLMWQYGFVSTSCLGNKKYAEFQISSATYYYFLAKVTELLDTVFFVLRKRERQITFLHVYHHSLMLVISWLTLKYDHTSCNTFLGTLNSFIHVIMYTYYGLSAFPGLAKYLWWKKYITSMQIGQFVLILVHVASNYAFSQCPISNISLSIVTFNLLLFIYLFGDFYVKAYTSKSDQPKTEYHIKIHHHTEGEKFEKVH